jgi:murE/murF fusion protein
VADLHHLLQTLPERLIVEVVGGDDFGEISSVTCDSREVRPGSMFVALRGCSSDGHRFINQAVGQGCSCVVVEGNVDVPPEVSVVRVTDSHSALGILSAAFHGFPARSMTMIGLTGTNGKTTVSWMLEQMLQSGGFRVGVIGTVNYRYQDRAGNTIVTDAPLTTPGPVVLQKMLHVMADAGVTHVVMETSSHALVQKRLEPIVFDVGVFTNLSRDHLDFHDSMEEYYGAKKLLFTRYLKRDGRAVIVTDSGEQKKSWGLKLCSDLEKTAAGLTVLTCGFDRSCEIRAENLRQDINGFSCRFDLQGEKRVFTSGLTGRYNVLNILAAAGVGIALGLAPEQIVQGLQEVRLVPGRLERVRLAGAEDRQQPSVFVDYAHTPDALRNVLKTLKKLAKGRVICVFGCGGDRDRGKRALMGEAAAELADFSIITSDNPRSEDPALIIDEIAEGMHSAGVKELSVATIFEQGRYGFTCITDRRTAVHSACSMAKPADIVLVAGKGHENYQITGSKRIFLDDRIEAVNGLLSWNTDHLLKATGGRIESGSRHCLLQSVSTDTRKLTQGDIFVALAGENFDGHDYVVTAVEAGAVAVIIDREVEKLPADVLVIRVKDTTQALGDLAAYRRRLLHRNLKVAAITGSSGKTTVKEMTAAIFSRYLENDTDKTGIDPLLKTAGNFNNLIGLPLSLLPVQAGHKMAILEMGMNHFGEIERLTEIADPDIGCITNVQAAHLEGLGSIEGVARAKGELFAGMRPETTAVVNFDDCRVRKLARTSREVIGFAVTANGRRLKPAVRATRIVNAAEQGMRFTLHIDNWKKRITVPAPGMHNVSNCAAAAAIAHAAGIEPETIVAALADYRSVDKRMQFMSLPGGIQVLNDCYNANPASMAAALHTLSSFGTDCRRIALLGDMLELGAGAVQAHEQIGDLVAELGYDQLAVTGAFAGNIAGGARDRGMADETVFQFSDTLAVADWLYNEMVEGRIVDGDWLLVKGSRGMRMERVLQELQHRFATGIKEGC